MTLTKKDFEKLSEIYATKKDMKDLKNELVDRFMTSHDEIIKKLDDMRMEKLMLLAQSRRHSDTIANHEERIVKLENKVLV